ncbi:hypothetical protein [Desulfosporosinus metallidurans]|uniref:Uncharacterized protein n=1 Tax=Desulfosporosinus metallidurans TaxID=1888891 RepID=A0A1Q8R0Z6_9FIRM|nr:hypothetical protein [Desulfosporosinus metallidurans]OLN33080.1 hypothetical protein DSOL_0807 [Desulfosporosinus metallidurans]
MMNRMGNILYPEVFNSKYIRTHFEFEVDLTNMLERSGQKADFWGKYKQRLRFLDERKEKCVLKSDWFEELRQAEGLYSMIFDKSQKNIRILFAFIEYNKVKYALLLCAFEEKDNKKKSQYCYSTRIPIAQKRLKEVLYND